MWFTSLLPSLALLPVGVYLFSLRVSATPCSVLVLMPVPVPVLVLVSPFRCRRQAVKLLRQCKFQQEPNYNQLANAFRDIQTVRTTNATTAAASCLASAIHAV